MSKCCPLYPRKMGYSACQLVDSWKIWGAALQADGETRSAYAASSIRRRSAAWTILLDDVSVKETSVCIVDDTGRIAREVKVASELRQSAAGADESRLPFQTDWIGT